VRIPCDARRLIAYSLRRMRPVGATIPFAAQSAGKAN
jgi:hypothetical protein